MGSGYVFGGLVPLSFNAQKALSLFLVIGFAVLLLLSLIFINTRISNAQNEGIYEPPLNKCSTKPDSYYRLPFSDDPAWTVFNGNWDDPKYGHSKGNPNGWQAYAFDFGYDPDRDGNGESGKYILAARGGTVYAVVESESGNSWGTGTPLGYKGVGNFLVIKHADGTFGTYWHLMQNKVFVTVGQKVNRGQLIALSDNTGNASTPHLHFDVRTGWDLGFPASKKEFPIIKIRFSDRGHTCWIPRVGESLDCTVYYNKIKMLEQEKSTLQADLKDAAPGMKPHLVTQIKQLNTQIDNLNKKITALNCATLDPAK